MTGLSPRVNSKRLRTFGISSRCGVATVVAGWLHNIFKPRSAQVAPVHLTHDSRGVYRDLNYVCVWRQLSIYDPAV